MNHPTDYPDQIRRLLTQVTSSPPPQRVAMYFQLPHCQANIVIIREPAYAATTPQQLREAADWLMQHGEPEHTYMGRRNGAGQKAGHITATIAAFHTAVMATGELVASTAAAVAVYMTARSITNIRARRSCIAAAEEIARLIGDHKADSRPSRVTEASYDHIPQNGISVAILPQFPVSRNV